MPNAEMRANVGDALAPAGPDAAFASIRLDYLASMWFVERCPYYQVAEIVGTRPDQALFPDFDLISNEGLGLGQAAPPIVASSERQLDPASIDYDNDPATMTDGEVEALRAELALCPSERWPEFVAARLIADEWNGGIVPRVIESETSVALQVEALDCLSKEEVVDIPQHAESLVAFFVGIDTAISSYEGSETDAFVRELDAKASAAYERCARTYFDEWLHPRLTQRHLELVDEHGDLIDQLAVTLDRHGLSL